MNYHIYGMNNNISAMLAILTDTRSKKDNREEKLTELSSKLSTYEEHMDR